MFAPDGAHGNGFATAQPALVRKVLGRNLRPNEVLLEHALLGVEETLDSIGLTVFTWRESKEDELSFSDVPVPKDNQAIALTAQQASRTGLRVGLLRIALDPVAKQIGGSSPDRLAVVMRVHGPSDHRLGAPLRAEDGKGGEIQALEQRSGDILPEAEHRTPSEVST
ncbi:MAG: hypothetical protein COZ06_01115 [Armatimonadetes bacterium CG_4_10_14_3_um_filter_66_18]|nr:hypothetical protein [Armatimonadota bacterium]OIO91716.1 MAG: hypothetical protein AUJ96_33420 [Armatimonadetes bacterium CG2_30_66_41]PIU92126.1 MAG: hypothetical protein COS65_19530 [Armatimonadetes bacterium CG06_land_8_20_14_3_00_66_21]PIX37252.1 MAG: hypothetical protein COZ57_35295 [Armatimonadetes bacterium CG_4_8_14_3_um_filter_66_20]PIY53813.1 MAG: hypothetical protein COZ06_01115 [Armatimonadetes bacterium CG_4_10_14_3_um_filter_66_18]PIZ32914.1 MAG: hypothetical protein COY42_30